jgi:hypothetical protein
MSAEQVAAWKRALADLARQQRAGRRQRKPVAAKAGMTRKAQREEGK